METAYEKVCPACGRSATLPAKFCSGCGHQYRTVFHDQAVAGDGGDGVQETQSQFDARWAPIVAITPVVIVMFMVASRAPVAQNAPAQTASAISYAPTTAPAADISNGMRPFDVQQALGKPNDIKVVPIGGITTQQWYYSRGGHTLEIHFNSSNFVDNWTNY